eukprot:scaffold3854_cov251-Pinguiococcus_pyrenoidosus.AAC.2
MVFSFLSSGSSCGLTGRSRKDCLRKKLLAEAPRMLSEEGLDAHQPATLIEVKDAVTSRMAELRHMSMSGEGATRSLKPAPLPRGAHTEWTQTRLEEGPAPCVARETAASEYAGGVARSGGIGWNGEMQIRFYRMNPAVLRAATSYKILKFIFGVYDWI